MDLKTITFYETKEGLTCTTGLNNHYMYNSSKMLTTQIRNEIYDIIINWPYNKAILQMHKTYNEEKKIFWIN
jgi:hypothetical protein